MTKGLVKQKFDLDNMTSSEIIAAFSDELSNEYVYPGELFSYSLDIIPTLIKPKNCYE